LRYPIVKIRLSRLNLTAIDPRAKAVDQELKRGEKAAGRLASVSRLIRSEAEIKLGKLLAGVRENGKIIVLPHFLLFQTKCVHRPDLFRPPLLELTRFFPEQQKCEIRYSRNITFEHPGSWATNHVFGKHTLAKELRRL